MGCRSRRPICRRVARYRVGGRCRYWGKQRQIGLKHRRGCGLNFQSRRAVLALGRQVQVIPNPVVVEEYHDAGQAESDNDEVFHIGFAFGGNG